MTILHYVADPMCSWCYGFQEALDALVRRLKPEVELRYLMGGLAPDSDEPMPETTRRYVQGAWRSVAERTGAEFNHDFWEVCAPRRSTYPACRAVIAAAMEGRGPEMFRAVQRAYYREARNPSDDSTLCELAGEIGLDPATFATRLGSGEVGAIFQDMLSQAREFGVQGFPSLVVERDDGFEVLTTGWVDEASLMNRMEEAAPDLLG